MQVEGWTGITGSTHGVTVDIALEVCSAVKNAFDQGKGIVVGGGLGVNYVATQKMLQLDPSASRIKIVLSTNYISYLNNLDKAAKQGVLSREEYKKLSQQIVVVHGRNKKAIVEMDSIPQSADEAYQRRNMRFLDASNSLEAFWINRSEGVNDIIREALRRDLDIHVRDYRVPIEEAASKS